MTRMSLGLSCALASFLAAACGGKVVVDVPGGAGGTGGASSSTMTTVSTGQGGTTNVAVVGPGPGTTAVVGTGPTPVGVGPQAASAVVVSSSSGGSQCDNTGDCTGCQTCSVNGPCAELWDKCQSFAPCTELLQCFNSCNGDQTCYDKCYMAFPDAQALYYELAICVLCQSCYVDCDGAGSGC